MTRSEAEAVFRAAAKAFIDAHYADQRGGDLVSRESIRAREQCQQALINAEAFDGLIEVIKTPVPPIIRFVDGKAVVELALGHIVMQADWGSGRWIDQYVRVTFEPPNDVDA